MPVSDYTPDVAEVGAILRSRTITKARGEAGTFNPASVEEAARTRPTAEQVETLIQESMDAITPIFGTDIPNGPNPEDPHVYRRGARRLAALGTALLIELGYFSEQVATGRSPYEQLLALYTTRSSNLMAVLGIDKDDSGTPDAGGVEGGYPSGGGFPTTAIGMEHPW